MMHQAGAYVVWGYVDVPVIFFPLLQLPQTHETVSDKDYSAVFGLDQLRKNPQVHKSHSRTDRKFVACMYTPSWWFLIYSSVRSLSVSI